MPASLSFFDMSASVTPPNGHIEPLPITLGPNWEPGDVRLFFISGSASESSGSGTMELPMTSDPPTNFTTIYAREAGYGTHGCYYWRLAAGDNDSSVYWAKPQGWRHFMVAQLTVRGLDPSTAPTGGTLTGEAQLVSYITEDSNNATTVSSVTVPHAGTMLFFIGNVAAPEIITWPNWAGAMGVPTGWTALVATPNSGNTFFQYDVNPCVDVIANSYSASGSTGSVSIPTGQCAPAFAGMYCFLTPAPDVTIAVGSA